MSRKRNESAHAEALRLLSPDDPAMRPSPPDFRAMLDAEYWPSGQTAKAWGFVYPGKHRDGTPMEYGDALMFARFHRLGGYAFATCANPKCPHPRQPLIDHDTGIQRFTRKGMDDAHRPVSGWCLVCRRRDSKAAAVKTVTIAQRAFQRLCGEACMYVVVATDPVTGSVQTGVGATTNAPRRRRSYFTPDPDDAQSFQAEVYRLAADGYSIEWMPKEWGTAEEMFRREQEEYDTGRYTLNVNRPPGTAP